MQKRKPAAKFQFEGTLDVDIEDSGLARIGHIIEDDETETGMFVRIHSWDPKKWHEEFESIQNARVRVTVEVVDDGDF